MIVMMVFLGDLADRNDTSMGHLAHSVLKLDGRVIDPKLPQEPLFHVAQDALAY